MRGTMRSRFVAVAVRFPFNVFAVAVIDAVRGS
jgi:hypothetical protein